MKLKLSDTFKIFFLCALFTSNILCSHTEVKEKINISEGFMKHRKSQIKTNNFATNNFANTNLVQKSEGLKMQKSQEASKLANRFSAGNHQDVQTFGANSNLLTQTNLAETADKLANSSQGDSNVIDLNIGSGPVFATGWISFFKYTQTSETKKLGADKTPRSFTPNGQFNEQLKMFPNGFDKDAKSSDGTSELPIYIPDNHSFYGILLKDSLNILTSRQTDIQKTFEIINVASLADIPELGGFPKGTGIEDFGNFAEGFCFKLNTVIPKSDVYVICCKDVKTKTNFMMYMKKMKINIQRTQGNVIIPKVERKDPETISGMINPEHQTKNALGNSQNLRNEDGNIGVGFDSNKNQSITDGYWIVLQNWSQCTLKCGGGKSYLQRMCVPPKNGGKPCQGQPIIEKDCNKQPCPKVETTKMQNTNNTQTLKPIVKIMPFSTRPQRYTKCVIKEGDMMYTKDLNEKDQLTSNMGAKPSDMDSVQVPVRVVMNNRTLSIFAGEDYDSHLIGFVLKRSTIVMDQKKPECFYVNQDDGKRARLCPFGCDSPKKAVDEWDYDFNLFKYQCNYGHKEHEVDFDQKLNNKIKQAKKALLDEAQEEMKRKAQDGEDRKLATEVKQTNKVALQAIQKEINLEEMIKLEEQEREKKEEQQMLQKIEDEKKKSECLMKAIKEKQLENQYNMRQKETELAIVNIKKAAAREVQIRRSNLKKMIDEMRKKQKRKTGALAQKLQSVRYQMAEQMGKAYKKGNLENCIKIGSGKDTPDKIQMRKHYCTANFADDFINHQNCMEGDDFCHQCCDNEFGEFYIGDREDCYSKSCVVATPAQQPKVDSNGRWIWQSEIIE